jgi:hypothetical protein
MRLRLVDTLAVDVADRDDPRALVPPDTGHVVAARDAAGTNRTNVDPVARGSGSKYRRGYDGREADERGGLACALDEFAAR